MSHTASRPDASAGLPRVGLVCGPGCRREVARYPPLPAEHCGDPDLVLLGEDEARAAHMAPLVARFRRRWSAT